MAYNGRFEFQGDHRTHPPLPATNPTTFSQLLFGADNQDHDSLALDLGHSFNHHNDKLPKMLCFGGGGDDHADAPDDLLFGNAGLASTLTQRSVLTCTDSCSSVSSANNKAGGSHHKSTNKKRGGNLELATIGTAKGTTTVAAGSQGGNKKNKGAAKGPVKARKERLGERIAALQQLVSPFGKTDAASVLHEAMGYIRFLQEQVQVLCSPYLQPLPVAATTEEAGENGAQGGEEKRDLRSRGLCLVPLACTLHVASTNGADFWSPAMANDARI